MSFIPTGGVTFAPSLTPILSANPVIQLHVAAALLAIGLLPFSLFRRRRDRLHKISGYAWVTAMLVTALSSFWISGIRLIGPFSPIHAVSVLTLFGVISGIGAIRRGDRRAHQATMRAIAFWGLGVAGFFTLLPGRVMNQALFGEAVAAGRAGFAAALVAAAVIAAWVGIRRAPALRLPPLPRPRGAPSRSD